MNDDLILCELIRTGDKQSFEYLFKTYFTPLCRFALLYVKQEIEAEELVYDLFSTLWEKREKLQISLSFKAYLFHAVRNRAMNYIRDKKIQLSIEESEALNIADNPDEHLEMEELERLIEEAIIVLPDRCRDIFIKSRKEHKKNAEIAEEFGISLKAVEAQITKALKKIKGHLGDSYYYMW